MKLGILYQYHRDHFKLMGLFKEIGGRLDIYEFLDIHFSKAPYELERFSKYLDCPEIIIHSSLLQLGNEEHLGLKEKINQLNELTRSINCSYVGDHFSTMGSQNRYSGSFLPPIFSPSQRKKLASNIQYSKQYLKSQLIVENPVEFFDTNGEYCVYEYLNDVCKETDTGIILSLSNIMMSEKFQDRFSRDKFFEKVDISKVKQVHIYLNNSREEKGKSRLIERQKWMILKLEELLSMSNFNPDSIIFETISETSSIVEPEKLKEYVDHFRKYSLESLCP